jgi:hypothetical protein
MKMEGSKAGGKRTQQAKDLWFLLNGKLIGQFLVASADIKQILNLGA